MKVFLKPIYIYPMRKFVIKSLVLALDSPHKAELKSLVLWCLLGVDYIQHLFQQHVNHKQHKFWHSFPGVALGRLFQFPLLFGEMKSHCNYTLG